MFSFFCNIIKRNLLMESRYFQSVLILFFVIVFSLNVSAQSALIDDIDYNQDSRSLVFMLNNNGFSSGFRFSKRIDGYKSRLIDLDLTWYKHPKEERSSGYYGGRYKFVYGKLNQLLIARAGYGRQKELYSKYSKKGVVISFYYLLGANVGLLKPVYFKVVQNPDRNPDGSFKTVDEKFVEEKGIHIFERASFFKGFDEIDLAFGAYARAAFSFDINKKYKGVNTLELGASVDFFHKPLPLMASNPKHPYIFTLFIAYRFGQKHDTSIKLE